MSQRENLIEQRERLLAQRERLQEFKMKPLRRVLTDKSVAPSLKLKNASRSNLVW